MAVEELPASYSVGSIIYSTEPLKRALVTETKAWKQAFGRALANKASADMEEIFTFFDNMCKRLSRPIKDLDDVRNTMAALREVRESEIKYVCCGLRFNTRQLATCWCNTFMINLFSGLT